MPLSVKSILSSKKVSTGPKPKTLDLIVLNGSIIVYNLSFHSPPLLVGTNPFKAE